METVKRSRTSKLPVPVRPASPGERAEVAKGEIRGRTVESFVVLPRRPARKVDGVLEGSCRSGV